VSLSDPLRVLIVEDNDRLRSDFRRLIDEAAGMTTVAVYGAAEDAVNGLRTITADVMLVDVTLPGMNGIEFVRRARAVGMPARIVMLITSDDPTTVFEALKAGADGYVLKRAALAELIAAVRDVASDGAPMTGAIARKVVQYFIHEAPAAVETLSDRECEVLVALSQGRQYAEIAGLLGISPSTVRTCIHGIYGKLHVNTRLEAVQKAEPIASERREG
jgi:DNA-binding NarL/FixJ family response regulator